MVKPRDLSVALEQFASRPLAFRCKPPLRFKYTGPNRAVRAHFAKRAPPPASDFVAIVQHKLNPPASANELKLLRYVLGPQAGAFYDFCKRHNGFKLYRETLCKPPLARSVGIEMFPIRRWKSATSAMKKIVHRFEQDDRYNVFYGVAFACVPRSENFFVTLVQGPHSGQIFYTHGDGAFVSRFAPTFEKFIQRITTRPVKLLTRDLGGYAHYQDGQTFENWTPFEVVRGGKSPVNVN